MTDTVKYEKTKRTMNDIKENPRGTEFIDYINVPVWIKNGGMLTRRDCLDWNNPEHTYNYVKKVLQDAGNQKDFGVKTLRPEDFGVKNPKSAAFEKYSRDELIDEIVELRDLVDSYEFNQVPFKCSR